jgi:predicted kinase
MRVIALSGAQSLLHPKFGEAEAGPDGVFDLPQEFADALLTHRGQFISEAEHITAQVARDLVDLADPHKIPQVLLELRTKITDLEAKLAEASGKTPPTPADPTPVKTKSAPKTKPAESKPV